MKTEVEKLIEQIEAEVLSWKEVTTGTHSMGGREFLFREKEFGHIHQNGLMDILFGKGLTAELLGKNLAFVHKYVPTAAVSYKVSSGNDIPHVLNLLRLSYLKHLQKSPENNQLIIKEIQTELEHSSVSFAAAYN